MKNMTKPDSVRSCPAGLWALGSLLSVALVACGGGSSYTGTSSTSSAAAAVVSTFSPATAVAGVATTYLVNGVNLPTTVVVTLAGGSCATPTNVTTTSFSVVCTAGTAAGTVAMIARNDLESKGGWWIGQQALVVTAAPTATVLLPDTGITASQCYAASSNALFSCTSVDAIALNDKQDGMVGRDVTSSDSTDGLLGSSYRLVGAVGATECVKDEVTGKTWQRVSSTLPAYPADPNKTSNAAAGDMTLKADAARDAANAAALCGYTDWTIPSPFDLQSLVNYGASSGVVAIDSNWFTAKSAGYFTSAQYLDGGGTYRWRVDFGRGIVTGVVDQWASAELRLMRAATPVATRFSYSSDGSEVTDAQTGLVWQRCSAGQTWSSSTSTCTGGASVYAHADALAYAKTQSGWRLPNVKELYSVVKTTTVVPAADATAFPSMPNTTGVAYWTSTPDVQSPASAWGVEFKLGAVASYTRSSANFVRLVR